MYCFHSFRNVKGRFQDTPIRTRQQFQASNHLYSREIGTSDMTEESKGFDGRIDYSTSTSIFKSQNQNQNQNQNQFTNMNENNDRNENENENGGLDDLSNVEALDNTVLYHDMECETPLMGKKEFSPFSSSFSDDNQAFTSAVSTRRRSHSSSNYNVDENSDNRNTNPNLYEETISSDHNYQNYNNENDTSYKPSFRHYKAKEHQPFSQTLSPPSSQSFSLPFSSSAKRNGFLANSDNNLSSNAMRGNYQDSKNDYFHVDFSENTQPLPIRRKVRFSEG